ncbi:MAG: hypothetical protein KF699_03330 [Phycisphaeraceae bacterium]|nr:hypothetical protein [Phycisphaeraceae bacterium]MBX3405540.1 hypothetical protein [Phycisphaeraceae bacterium]
MAKQTATTRPHPHEPAYEHVGAAAHSPRAIADTRTLFWHNVVREMLNDLALLCQMKPELFDGRFGVVTNQGVRVGIKTIFPLFACSIPGVGESSWEREASIAVQCTVFRIATPDGEIYTLPVHEVAAVHAMTPELIEQLAKAEEQTEEGQDPKESRPFGLAAFTSLPRIVEPEQGEHPI